MAMEEQVSPAFGGFGLPEAPRVSVNVTDGSLWLGMTPPPLPGLGAPLEVDFSYDSRDSYKGILGRGHGSLGEVGRHVNNLAGSNPKAIVTVHRDDGENQQFRGYGDNVTWIPIGALNSTLVKNADGSWKNLRTDFNVENYDAYGYIHSTVPQQVPPHYYYYDAPGSSQKLERVKDSSGRFCYFDYSGSTASDFRDWGGRRTQFTYDGSSDLTGIVNPDGGTTYFQYSGSVKRVTAMVAPAGETAYFAYGTSGASSGKIVRQYLPQFGTTYYYYDTSAKKTTVVNPRGYPTYFYYDGTVVTKVTDAQQQSTLFAGDGSGPVSRHSGSLLRVRQVWQSDQKY